MLRCRCSQPSCSNNRGRQGALPAMPCANCGACCTVERSCCLDHKQPTNLSTSLDRWPRAAPFRMSEGAGADTPVRELLSAAASSVGRRPEDVEELVAALEAHWFVTGTWARGRGYAPPICHDITVATPPGPARDVKEALALRPTVLQDLGVPLLLSIAMQDILGVRCGPEEEDNAQASHIDQAELLPRGDGVAGAGSGLGDGPDPEGALTEVDGDCAVQPAPQYMVGGAREPVASGEPGWQCFQDPDSGYWYWYHAESGESMWCEEAEGNWGETHAEGPASGEWVCARCTSFNVGGGACVACGEPHPTTPYGGASAMSATTPSIERSGPGGGSSGAGDWMALDSSSNVDRAAAPPGANDAGPHPTVSNVESVPEDGTQLEALERRLHSMLARGASEEQVAGLVGAIEGLRSAQQPQGHRMIDRGGPVEGRGRRSSPDSRTLGVLEARLAAADPTSRRERPPPPSRALPPPPSSKALPNGSSSAAAAGPGRRAPGQPPPRGHSSRRVQRSPAQGCDSLVEEHFLEEEEEEEDEDGEQEGRRWWDRDAMQAGRGSSTLRVHHTYPHTTHAMEGEVDPAEPVDGDDSAYTRHIRSARAWPSPESAPAAVGGTDSQIPAEGVVVAEPASEALEPGPRVLEQRANSPTGRVPSHSERHGMDDVHTQSRGSGPGGGDAAVPPDGTRSSVLERLRVRLSRRRQLHLNVGLGHRDSGPALPGEPPLGQTAHSGTGVATTSSSSSSAQRLLYAEDRAEASLPPPTTDTYLRNVAMGQ